MLKNLKTIIIILLLIDLTFSLNLADFCHAKNCSHNKFKFKCSTGLCASSEKSCEQFSKSQFQNSFRFVTKLKSQVGNCPNTSKKSTNNLSINDFCENDLECLDNKYFWLSKYEKLHCSCTGHYSFQCGKKYCTLNSSICDIINQSKTSTEQFNISSKRC